MNNETSTPTLAAPVLFAGPAVVQKLVLELQEKGFDCEYKELAVADEAGATDLSFKRLSPVLTEAKEGEFQLLLAAQPEEYKLTAAVRKTADAPFQLLSPHQLAVVLADLLSSQAAENDFVCVKSVVMTDLLEKMLSRKGYSYKTEMLTAGNLAEVVTATAKATGASTVLGVTENGEFYCNKGFAFLLEELLKLQNTLEGQQQLMFDHLLGLYYYYGFYREKTLVVNMADPGQEAHYNRLMDSFRKAKKPQLASYTIKEIWDYQRKKMTNLETGKQHTLDMPVTNLLKVVFSEGISLMMAPVEDKMYLYLSLSGKLMRKENYSHMSREFDQKLLKLVEIVNQL